MQFDLTSESPHLTFQVGELPAITYRELVTILGEPNGQGDGYKVDVEWVIMFGDGTLATIHNWKNGPSYGAKYKLEDITNWSIGGYSERAAIYVRQLVYGGR